MAKLRVRGKMKKTSRIAILLLVVSVLLTACQGTMFFAPPTPTATPRPTSTPTPMPSPTPSPVPTLAPLPTLSAEQVCNPDQIVYAIRGSAPDGTISVVRTKILETEAVDIWLVDPTLAGSDTEGNAAPTDREILGNAVNIFYQVFYNEPCIGSAFDLVKLTLVDDDYNLRFSGSMIPARIPGGAPDGEGAVQAYIDVLEDVRIGRQTGSGAGSRSLEENACSWGDVRQRLLHDFDGSQTAVGLQIERDADEVVTSVQWVGPDPRISPALFYTGLLHLADQMACLDPAVDRVWIAFTDVSGDAHVFGRLDGELIRQGTSDEILSGFVQLFP